MTGGTTEWFAEPSEFGLEEAPLEEVAGGEPEENAATARAILAGDPGPAADIALLNAGAAIYVGGGTSDLATGVDAAREAIDSGAAAEVLRKLVDLRNRDRDG